MIAIIKHVEIEGPGIFEFFLRVYGQEIKIIELARGDKLPKVDECTAIISLGGPMSVYDNDKYEFLSEEELFLKQAIDKEIPTLGICLGAQLLAKVCGVSVSKAEKPETGWFKVKLTKAAQRDVLFENLKNTLMVFQWHEDTFNLPKGSSLLVRGDLCRNQAVRFAKYAWGLQFHPEMNAKMIKDWVRAHPHALDEKKAIASYFKYQEMYLSQAKMICANFMGLVAKKVSV